MFETVQKFEKKIKSKMKKKSKKALTFMDEVLKVYREGQLKRSFTIKKQDAWDVFLQNVEKLITKLKKVKKPKNSQHRYESQILPPNPLHNQTHIRS